MSEIVDHMASGSMVLFNESFAATNEREGSQIVTQIVNALTEEGSRSSSSRICTSLHMIFTTRNGLA
ncbi:hypothetical protein [Mesorhizobium sp. M1409]|uniref:hypothetical protein n=1 Tax=unclassified Mesorhizobium TaxID=325217 RepID=UPI00333DF437